MADPIVADPGGAPSVTPTDPGAAATLAGGATPPGTSSPPPPAPAPATPPPAPAPSATPAADTPPATLAGGATPPLTQVQVQATWPEKWREEMAAGDDKKLQRLQRFASPLDVWKSYSELEGKVSSGELKAAPKPLAADATPEQATAWRKENGLPDTAEAFVAGLQLPQGMVAGEADKPLLESFAQEAFAQGWTPERYNQAVGWYYKLQDSLLADQQRGDQDSLNTATVELMREWGAEFKVNQTRVTQLFDGYFPKEADDIRAARLPDGRLVGNDPTFNRVFLEIAKTLNPVASVLPNIAGANMTNVNDRITEIEQRYMRATPGSDDWKAYNRGEAGSRMQQEYRDLVTTRETMKERQGAGR